MIDHVLVVFGWWPGKDENVVPFSSFDLSEGAVANLLHRNEIHRYLGVVPFAPVRGHHVDKPVVKLGEKVRPFCDLQGLRCGESVGRKKEERTESGGASC